MSRRRMLLGLIGANIMGSLSPCLFADAFEAAGIDGFYHLMDVDRLRERRLRQLLDAIKAAGFAGTNVTYPFKQEVLPLLDNVDPEAAQVGAINTVAIAPDGRTTGYNFDRAGWRHSFAEAFGANAARGATVVLVGAGGAGHAVAFALMDLAVGLLVVHDRDRARAKALCDDLTGYIAASRCRVAGDLEDEIRAADGVVNATQAGMRGSPAIPCRHPRSRPRIGQPTSSIRRSIPNSSRPRPRKAHASSTAAGCAFIRRSRLSGYSQVSRLMSPAFIAHSPPATKRAKQRSAKWVDSGKAGKQTHENLNRHGMPQRWSE